MKAVLEFSLPEERWEHERAVHSGEAWMALSDLDNYLRNLIKHGSESSYPSTVSELADTIRKDYLSEPLSKILE